MRERGRERERLGVCVEKEEEEAAAEEVEGGGGEEERGRRKGGTRMRRKTYLSVVAKWVLNGALFGRVGQLLQGIDDAV